MSILSFLCFFLLSAHIASSYTVVLASGKRIEGSLVSDQPSTVVIRDSQGVFLSFKKSILDWSAMTTLNVGPAAQEHMQSTPRASRKPPALAEIAAETRRRRTGKSRNVHLEELQNAREISILGSEDIPGTADSAGGHASISERDWNSRLWTMKKEVNRLREKRLEAESACEESRQKQYAARTKPSHKPVDLLSTYKETAACRKFTEMDQQLQEAEGRLENAREEARRAGVSWQTLE